MVRMIDEQFKWDHPGTIFNAPNKNEILEECLNIFFDSKKHDGTYTWNDKNFKYHAYYDDDIVFKVSKKRIIID